MHGSWQSLHARLCQLQAKVDKINHAKGKPGSASCELFVGRSQSKERWVDISWARNQGLDRVDGPINPQKAAWSDRFEFQIVESGQRKWLKVTRVDTNEGWGQQLRVSMTSSSADTRLCQWKQPTSVSRSSPEWLALGSGSPSGATAAAPPPPPASPCTPPDQSGSPSAPPPPTTILMPLVPKTRGPPRQPATAPPPHLLLSPPAHPPPKAAAPRTPPKVKAPPSLTPTEDYVRKERAKEQRSAAVAAGNKDSHRLWLDNKYAKRTQKRLAKQSAKEGFA